LKNKIHIIGLFFLLLCSDLLFSQLDKKQQVDSEEFTNEMTIGLNTNTNSALIGGFTFKYAKRIKKKQSIAFGLELVNVKSHKEEKFASISTGNSFIPGKVNYLYSLRTQMGKEYLLFGKYPEDGIRLSAIVMGGLSWGIVKPYFIEYDYSPEVGYPDYRIEPYEPGFHQLSRILGKGGFFHGFDQLKLQMGLNAKASLNFEFGKGELLESVSGIEVGFNIEYFPKEVEIFAVEDNPNVYTSLFLVFYIGSRY
jgi:hypothetical protein